MNTRALEEHANAGGEGVKLSFANIQVDFVDRERAIRWIEYWANRGMALPHVIYGPEGCGKTAWLRQSAELLKGCG